jgi:DNA (cytosine-5)-methyltransferase 1
LDLENDITEKRLKYRFVRRRGVAPLLTIGTDCSGIEAPIQALQQLGIPHRHIWSCDIDNYCIQSIKANYKPEILFRDMTSRDPSELPDIDLYICGFPCQPFSVAGKRKGMSDQRGIVFWNCIQVLKVKKPKYFILENVKGLLTIDKGKTFKTIIRELEKLPGYNIQYTVLNTRDYGIPHNRERVYIVGTKGEFKWPTKLPLENIKTYVDQTDNKVFTTTKTREKMLRKVLPDKVFVDFDRGVCRTTHGHKYIMCITTNPNHWCVPKHRKANTLELMRFQGFPSSFKQVVSKTQFKKQLGNTMSVNVVEEILKKLL